MWLTLYRRNVSFKRRRDRCDRGLGHSTWRQSVTSVLSAFRSSFRTGIYILLGAATAGLWLAPLQAQQNPQQGPVVMDHDGSTVMFEPYAPNIIRVTLSMQHDPAVAAPGYGFVAKPNTDRWTHTSDDLGDTYRSSRLVVTLDASHRGGKPSLTQADIAKFFTGSTPGAHIRVTTPEGATLVDMVGWQQSVPNHKD